MARSLQTQGSWLAHRVAEGSRGSSRPALKVAQEADSQCERVRRQDLELVPGDASQLRVFGRRFWRGARSARLGRWLANRYPPHAQPSINVFLKDLAASIQPALALDRASPQELFESTKDADAPECLGETGLQLSVFTSIPPS